MLTFTGMKMTEGPPGIIMSGFFGRSAGPAIRFEFAFDPALLEWVSDRHDHWFILGVTSAFVLGEDYSHGQPVCSVLYRNMQALVKQWHAFYPTRRPIRIHNAEVREYGPGPEGRKVASLFTGGIDSSFTLKHKRAEIGLLMKASFPFDNFGSYSFLPERRRRFEEQTARFGIPAITIGTNMLDPFPEFRDSWANITHAPALASIGHLFQDRISKVFVSSSVPFGELIPWGSHPLTDPLLSSASVTIDHFGATFSRYEKVRGIAHDSDLLRTLSVCGRSPAEKRGRENCSACPKCIRTMVALDLSGASKEDCASFDWSGYDMNAIRSVKLHHRNDYVMFQEIVNAAVDTGRRDIARAASRAMRASSIFRPLAGAETMLRNRFPSIARYAWAITAKNNFYKAFRGG